ncbi:MAG: hypothetical protein JXB13_06670, partial [Phycisphaerae bacterium]|nr:hypothetical protein [Phycisphaerae bacterium]
MSGVQRWWPAGHRPRLGVVGILALGFLASCGGATESDGPTAVAKSDLDGYLIIYIGEPGVEEWIPVIEVDGEVPFTWTRIAVPDDLPPGSPGTARFDLATDCEVTVAQHFPVGGGNCNM